MEVLRAFRAPAGRRTLEAVLSPTSSGGHMAVSVFVNVGDRFTCSSILQSPLRNRVGLTHFLNFQGTQLSH